MAPWRLTLLVTLWVAIDVANPMLPGALAFSVEESVEGHQGFRFRPNLATTVFVPVPARLTPIEPVLISTRPVPVPPRVPPGEVTRAHLPLRAPASSGEDD